MNFTEADKRKIKTKQITIALIAFALAYYFFDKNNNLVRTFNRVSSTLRG